jgi:hypothetical protein
MGSGVDQHGHSSQLRERPEVDEVFAELMFSYQSPTTKAVVSRTDDDELDIFFSASGYSIHVPADLSAGATIIFQHYYGSGSVVALWCRLPSEEFMELLHCIENRGVCLVCSHEQHAVFRF